MDEIFTTLSDWRSQQESIALATVVETWRSSPRPVGAKLATTLSGKVAGSVSAGCVEGAIIETSYQVIRSGVPRLLTFGVTDDDAWGVGLTCGGTIKVFVEPAQAFDGIYTPLMEALEARRPFVIVTVLDGIEPLLNHKCIFFPDGHSAGDLALLDADLRRVKDAALAQLDREEGGEFALEDGAHFFLDVYPPVPRLVVVGAVHIAEKLIAMANLLGFDTILIDPRKTFATEERFPHVQTLIQEWPQKALPRISLDRFAYVVSLTHDPKFDDPTLQIALGSDARYVGVLGSRRSHAMRLERLREAGLDEAQLARIHAPIGLPLGERSPAEIAVSILAEIIQVRSGVS
ncbi:MAG: XdhC family protein [Anaerolineae bacterium]|nr:XdhC family protein [Anaerolineae bacterium]